jgi:hypothetical protein
MSIRAYVVALGAATALAVGCEGRSPVPVSPSNADQGKTTSIAGPDAGQRLTAVAEHGHTVILSDGCDPTTFNDKFGEGTCIRPGGVRLPNFLEELTNHQSVGAWHMAPNEVTLRAGEVLSAFNHGGEVHSFTEVKEFGGGFFQPINEIMGLTEIPECALAQAQGAVLKPGESSSEVEDEEGVEKYQCCIHPWMRAQVRITK